MKAFIQVGIILVLSFPASAQDGTLSCRKTESIRFEDLSVFQNDFAFKACWNLVRSPECQKVYSEIEDNLEDRKNYQIDCAANPIGLFGIS